MAGDKKGKGKAVVEPKKKRSRDECEWARALAATDAEDHPQRSVKIRGLEAVGAIRHTTVMPFSAYPHHRDSSALTASLWWSTDPRGCSSKARDSHTATAAARAAVRG